MKRINLVKSKFAMLIILALLFTSSCITNRDLEYFHTSKNVSKVKVNANDYRLQVGDLISVQISTVTQQQHDFCGIL